VAAANGLGWHADCGAAGPPAGGTSQVLSVMLTNKIARLAVCVAFGICATFGQTPTSTPHTSEKTGRKAEIDPFYFMAGICAFGPGRGYSRPPQCEMFFPSETRVAELFFAATQTWNQGVTSHYADGNRGMVVNAQLSKALQNFYAYDAGEDSFNALLNSGRPQHLSFLAGVYARRCRDGVFHLSGPDTETMKVIFCFLWEGCQITDFDYRNREIPNTVHFRVVPSPQVAQFFATIDDWQPAHVEWKSK
jgi:hypothetical protein